MSVSVRYTRELLTESARHCSNIEEVINYCGGRVYRGVRRHLVKRFNHFGIDISHFHHVPRRTAHSRPTKAALQEAVSASVSMAAALRHLGKPVNARARALFHQWVTEEGISTSHFLGQAHQRGKPGTTPTKPPERILVKHDGRYRTPSVMLRRALKQIGVPERCVECGTGPTWGGKSMTLEIDHISGDWSDNRAENLRLLCPNCHAITSTWCRGGTRRRTG
ncbi:HNH endonuclease [Streptomyces purpurogeneiscleroticus]|uniref:HNH endonuclease n=1 Tax=Streptomyces purpurogeneiscleroticus TaxID=68259 RepID=UPI001CBF4E99|nr:HNH endonuclease [Streptomyces purpurogeneiscleroticus]MBZ4018232.1 endonuclease [Streptomyces purpurogeneiscleroticus]